MSKRLTIIGCGPGNPEYFTPEGRSAAEAADVLVGTARVLELISEDIRKTQTCLEMKGPLSPLLDQVDALAENTRVAVLVTGDTGVASLAQTVIKRFGRKNCHLVPGISSIQMAFARLGLDWMGAEILSMHHEKPDFDIDCLAKRDRIAALAGSRTSCGWIADLADALPGHWKVFACEDLSLPEETISEVSVETLRKGDFVSRTVIVLVSEERWSR